MVKDYQLKLIELPEKMEDASIALNRNGIIFYFSSLRSLYSTLSTSA